VGGDRPRGESILCFAGWVDRRGDRALRRSGGGRGGYQRHWLDVSGYNG